MKLLFIRGAKLGAYEIVGRLGSGGMGEVWRARDTKLDREVAIKVLPESMTRDSERVARFEREAKLLASLNHSNIAVIHGFDEVDGTRFLVMEYVEGETLAQRIRRGPCTVDDALDIAKQMAEAIESAHEKGVIHRDLKPANVMIRSDGVVKVLDFGLAKATIDEPSSSAPADSPTLTAHYTRPGVVLGTAAYMSPEQARGRSVDRRTDIWSFGVVLLECLTGRTTFGGETVSDSIGAILHKEPDWSCLPPTTPTIVQLLLRRCLAKDRRRRLQAIGDARVELEDISRINEILADDMVGKPSTRGIVRTLPWGFCCVLAVAMAIMSSRDRGEPVAIVSNSVKKSVIALPTGTSISWRGTDDTWGTFGFSQLLAISRAGRQMMLTVRSGENTSLYVKGDKDFAPKKVEGTSGARGAFLSPDGLWVGFVTGHVMYKVRLPGGTAQSICKVNSAGFDATWLDDGTIVYSTDHGLHRVSSDGGESKKITALDMEAGERGHHFPHGIVGARSVIFTLANDEGQHAAVLSLDDATWKIVKPHATNARYVPGGYLVFGRSDELLASRYDPIDPTTLGPEEPIVRGVRTIPGHGGAVVYLFATSHTGKLIYAPEVDPQQPDSLLWVDHEGNEEEIVRGTGYWMHPRLSPNGDRILFNRLTGNGMFDLYMYDFHRDQINPLTRGGLSYDAEWSPDGTTVCFNSLDSDGRATYLIPTDFSGEPQRIIAGETGLRVHVSQWSNDGSTLVFTDRSMRGGIWTTEPAGGKMFQELLNSVRGEEWPRISPDGSLIAYVGFVSGRRNIYVQAYPGLGARIRISNNGGGEPRWAHDSRTLYFRDAEQMFRANIDVDPRLELGSVVTLPFADVYDWSAAGHQHYDLSLDSKRFLMVKHGRRRRPTKVHVIENWGAIVGKSAERRGHRDWNSSRLASNRASVAAKSIPVTLRCTLAE